MQADMKMHIFALTSLLFRVIPFFLFFKRQLEGKNLNDMDLQVFLINQYVSRFSPFKTSFRKARESFIYQKIVKIKATLLFFPYSKLAVQAIFI